MDMDRRTTHLKTFLGRELWRKMLTRELLHKTKTKRRASRIFPGVSGIINSGHNPDEELGLLAYEPRLTETVSPHTWYATIRLIHQTGCGTLVEPVVSGLSVIFLLRIRPLLLSPLTVLTLCSVHHSPR